MGHSVPWCNLAFSGVTRMGNALSILPMTSQEFLLWDETQTVRHEFYGGEVYAMTGVSERHFGVAFNVISALRAHLRGTPCRTFGIDIKLSVESAGHYFYPDAFVTCSAADSKDPLIKREPMLVVEVLSPSTAAYDRGDKFQAYRTLPSLREYLLIDTDRRRCDLHRLGDDGLWVLHPSEPGFSVLLTSVDLELTADVLWDEVPLPTANAPASDQSATP